MRLEHHPHTNCNAPIPHHAHGDQWTTLCHNPSNAKCYKCDKFYCCDHIRRHDCDGVDDHPSTD